VPTRGIWKIRIFGHEVTQPARKGSEPVLHPPDIPSGPKLLDATASANVTSVYFELTGGTLHHRVISHYTLSQIGWVGGWNTTSVPDGTYTLQSVATNFDDVSETSAGVTIHLRK